jgi:hypothetical protein
MAIRARTRLQPTRQEQDEKDDEDDATGSVEHDVHLLY